MFPHVHRGTLFNVLPNSEECSLSSVHGICTAEQVGTPTHHSALTPLALASTSPLTGRERSSKAPSTLPLLLPLL